MKYTLSLEQQMIVLHAQWLLGDRHDEHKLHVLIKGLIALKELRYRSLARDLADEFLKDHLPSSYQFIYDLTINIYSAIGPIDAAWRLVEASGSVLSDDEIARIKLILAERDPARLIHGKDRRLVDSFPDKLLQTIELKKLISSLIEQEAENVLNPPVFTLGSCFAQNLSRAMRATGTQVESLWISEDLNTPLANLDFIENLLTSKRSDGLTKPVDSKLESAYSALCSSKTIVFTLGVCANYFDNDCNSFVLHDSSNLRSLRRNIRGNYKYRHYSVIEVKNILLRILKLLEEHTSMERLILTVSPVPLSAWLGEGDVFSADTLSKATLRVAAKEIVEAHENVSYLPTFEIFRTLPAFSSGQPFFGADDESARHPSAEMVEIIVSSFIHSWFYTPNGSVRSSGPGSD